MTDLIIKKLPYDLTFNAGLALVGQYMKRLGCVLVIPVDVKVNDLNEFFDCCFLPVPRIEQLCFQPPEESFAGRIIW